MKHHKNLKNKTTRTLRQLNDLKLLISLYSVFWLLAMHSTTKWQSELLSCYTYCGNQLIDWVLTYHKERSNRFRTDIKMQYGIKCFQIILINSYYFLWKRWWYRNVLINNIIIRKIFCLLRLSNIYYNQIVIAQDVNRQGLCMHL